MKTGKDILEMDDQELKSFNEENKKKVDPEVVSPKKEAASPVLIEMSSEASMKFANQVELANAAKMMIKLELAPEKLRKEGIEAVASAMIMCRQFGLPDTAMNEMGYVKGKLTTYGSLVTALAERHPLYGDMESFFITEQGDKICFENKNLKEKAWAHVRRVRKKNSSVWNEYFFSLDDAEQAGILNRNTSSDSAWVKYTKDLLGHKTKARAFKDNYASALNGIHYHEDVIESIEDMPKSRSREVSDVASELSKSIKETET